MEWCILWTCYSQISWPTHPARSSRWRNVYLAQSCFWRLLCRDRQPWDSRSGAWLLWMRKRRYNDSTTTSLSPISSNSSESCFCSNFPRSPPLPVTQFRVEMLGVWIHSDSCTGIRQHRTDLNQGLVSDFVVKFPYDRISFRIDTMSFWGWSASGGT